jgi:hypothetical protein
MAKAKAAAAAAAAAAAGEEEAACVRCFVCARVFEWKV